MKNKYGLEISQELLDEYIITLRNGTYKLLPLYEGLNITTKQIDKSPELAYEDFQKYLTTFILEVSGAFYAFNDSVQFIKLLNTLNGMQTIEINQHSKIKSAVFHCIDICKKLKESGGK